MSKNSDDELDEKIVEKIISDIKNKTTSGRKYHAAWGTRFYNKVDVNAVVNELTSISDTTPEGIVEKARDSNTELHKCFEWDDTKAAEKYRRSQAITMVHSIKIAYTDKSTNKVHVTPIRMFSMPEKRGGAYVPTELVMKNVDQYQMLLEKAITELKAFKTKYKMLNELQQIFDFIDNI